MWHSFQESDANGNLRTFVAIEKSGKTATQKLPFAGPRGHCNQYGYADLVLFTLSVNNMNNTCPPAPSLRT